MMFGGFAAVAFFVSTSTTLSTTTSSRGSGCGNNGGGEAATRVRNSKNKREKYMEMAKAYEGPSSSTKVVVLTKPLYTDSFVEK